MINNVNSENLNLHALIDLCNSNIRLYTMLDYPCALACWKSLKLKLIGKRDKGKDYRAVKLKFVRSFLEPLEL